jgi:uncharacterized glyoxalase superfamily protein PhnB
MTKPIPDGYNRACPYLVCNNAAEVMEFVKKTFGAEERGTLMMPDGKVAHGELRIGDSVIMISDGSPDKPKMPGLVHVYVENSDEVYARALAAGGTSLSAVETMFYGDRSGGVQDVGGNQWWISTRVKDVSVEEMQKQMLEMASQKS